MDEVNEEDGFYSKSITRRRCRNDNISDEEYDCEENGDRLRGDMNYEMKQMKNMIAKRMEIG